MIANPYNPEIIFDYTSNKILGELFSKPYPVDIEKEGSERMILSKYFKFTEPLAFNKAGEQRECSEIEIKEAYYAITEKERNKAFICLCNFLARLNRPYKEIVLALQHYSSEETKLVSVGYKEPRYDVDVSENMDGIIIRFLEKDKFEEIMEYGFGPNNNYTHNGNMVEFAIVNFFRFVLTY